MAELPCALVLDGISVLEVSWYIPRLHHLVYISDALWLIFMETWKKICQNSVYRCAWYSLALLDSRTLITYYHMNIFYISLMILPPPNGEGYVFMTVSLWVGLSISNITGKWLKGFSWNFQDTTNMTPSTVWNILGMFHLTPCIQELFFFVLFFFFHLSGPCLLATLQTNGSTDLHQIFGRGRIYDKEQSLVNTFSRIFQDMEQYNNIID